MIARLEKTFEEKSCGVEPFRDSRCYDDVTSLERHGNRKEADEDNACRKLK